MRTFSLPSQAGNSGKSLKTDGTNVYWDLGAGGVVATLDLLNQGAAIAGDILYNVPDNGEGDYLISWTATIKTAGAVSGTLGGFGVTVVGPDAISRQIYPINITGVNISTTNTTATGLGGSFMVYAGASTIIRLIMGYATGTGTAMKYDLHVKVQKL
jgi:hypothetical protein